MLFKHLLPAVMATVAVAQSTVPNITALLSSTDQLSTLAGLVVKEPALLKTLEAAKDITIIAPNNAAFSAFLAANPNPSSGAVTDILEYHVLPIVVTSDKITSTPIFAHSLLVDPTLTNVTGGQFVEAVNNGSNVNFITGLGKVSTVVTADVKFTGGIVHIVDTVLTVPLSDSDTAIDAGLTSLAGALTKAGLVSTVNGLTNVTIFAPSNAAFEAIGSATNELTAAQLTSILEYHVVPNTIAFSTDLKNGEIIPTLQGTNVTITIQNGDVFVNSAKVITPNVIVANGVVHVLDNVLNPADPSATPVSGDPPAFAGVSSVTTAPFTSGITAPAAPTATAAGTTAPASNASGKATSSTGSAASSSGSASPSSSTGGAMPIQAASVGAAALFGLGGAFLVAGQMV